MAKPRISTRPIIPCIVLAAAGVSSLAAELPRAQPERTLILAHTMPWFEAKPVSPRWGWHWTMNTFDPDRIESGQRAIAAHYHPQIGPYDSHDPAVIEYQLLTIKLAGIDGIIVPWSGLSSLYDYPIIHRNTQALHDAAARFGMTFAICYEDQTIPKLVAAGRFDAKDRVAHALREIEWLQQHWFTSSSYLTLRGRPVLLSFGLAGLSDAEWTEVLNALKAPPVYVSEHHRRTAALGAFDWPLPKKGLEAVDRFYAAAKEPAWKLMIPAAFPRFHDIYAEAKIHASWGHIDDDNGRTFTTTLERALRSGAPFVQIATWNDWGEGTIIEPSVEFGDRDLRVIQRLRRQLVDPGFASTTEDLALPRRLFELRRAGAARRGTDSTLDEAARLLSAGKTKEASRLLSTAEGRDR